MTPRALLALVCAAVLICRLEARPSGLDATYNLVHRARSPDESIVEAQLIRELLLPTWLFPRPTTTTTTLTVLDPDPTSSYLPVTTVSEGGIETTTASSSDIPITATSPLESVLEPVPSTTGTSTTLDVLNGNPSSEVVRTATMPADIPTTSEPPATADNTSNGADLSIPDNGSSSSKNKILIITLSTVLPVVALVLLCSLLYYFFRSRRRHHQSLNGRNPFFRRGVSPIDDEEIATWKAPRNEKHAFHGAISGADTDLEADAIFAKETGVAGSSPPTSSHTKNPSTGSVKKPPSVIVYSRPSLGQPSPYSAADRLSFEKTLPDTPILAKAHNARIGLTDESVPGDDPYIPPPKRQPSRLSKAPPPSYQARKNGGHTRARSSRSSTRSFASGGIGNDFYSTNNNITSPATAPESETDLASPMSSMRGQSQSQPQTPRQSCEGHVVRPSRSFSRTRYPQRRHSRLYSSSSVPPRVSLGDDGVVGGLSPPPARGRSGTVGGRI